MGINVSFRDVDEGILREFRAFVAREGLKSGVALSDALRYFLSRVKTSKKKPLLSDFKPVDLGPNMEHLSSQVDEVVYGWKK